MTNEFLSFVVLRAPEPTDLSNEKTKPVTVNVEGGIIDSLDLVNPDKEKVYKKALLHLEKSTVYDLEKLPLPLDRFMKWYEHQQLTISDEMFISAISRLLAIEFTSLVTSIQFSETKKIIIKGLILSSIADKNVEFIRPGILRAFKFISAFEKLSELQSQDPARDFNILLQRTVLLPKEVFPVNFESGEYRTKKEEFKNKKAKLISEQQKKTKELSGKLQQYKDATSELLNSFDIRINRLNVNVSPDEGSGTGSARITSSPPVKASFFNSLNKTAVEKLSSNTKTILKKENLNLDTVNVPIAINRLENAQKKLYADLLGVKKPFGGLFEPIPIFQIVAPTPGYCSVSHEPDISVPEADFPPKKGEGFFNNKYSGDLQKVRQTLKRYELGEIAAIENVMIGERKVANYRQLQKIEESITTSAETVEESEKEMQTNDQFKLQTESSKTVSEDKSKEAGITVTGSYGAITATATGNIAVHGASEESKNTSTSYARDILDRSVQKIKEKILKETFKKTTSETEKKQEHSFDNTGKDEHVNGVYQWVNKIYEVQVVNYGLRQFFEFIIPDPAGFFRFAIQNKPVEGLTRVRPDKPGYCLFGVFNPLGPKDLTEFNYTDWVEIFNLTDVTPPPEKLKTITFNKSFSAQSSSQDASFITTDEANISIPKNYVFLSGQGNYTYGRANVFDTGPWDSVYYSILIANREIARLSFSRRSGDPGENDAKNEAVTLSKSFEIDDDVLSYLSNDSNTRNNLTISVSGFGTLFTINIGLQLLFGRTESSFEQWQIETYNKIMTAYNDSLDQYNREVESKQFDVFANIRGRNPIINREIEKVELKKQCLSQFTGQNFGSFYLMTEVDPLTGFPQQNNKKTHLGGKYIQFFENAFEWENMTYIFYDYYWSNKEEWPGILGLKDTDPLFEKFLKAGAARVQVPIRQGFQNPLFNFCQFQPGAPWDGTTEAPLLGGDSNTIPFLSMLDEIKAQMNVDFENRPGTITVEEESVVVIGHGTDFRATKKDGFESDIDREIIINAKSYRVASIQDAEHLKLRRPFKKEKVDENTVDIGYYLGVKFVGEPWEILVPTELVYLSKLAIGV